MARSFEVLCTCPGCGFSDYHLLEVVSALHPGPLRPYPRPGPAWRDVAHLFDELAVNVRRRWFKRECLQCRATWKEQEEREPSPARAWLDERLER